MLNDPTMMHKCYSVSRSPIDENNDSVSKSWIVFRHGIVAKLTFGTEFSAAEDLANCRLRNYTIKPTSVGKSQILSSRRCDVTTVTLIFRNSMLRNTSVSHKPLWQQ